MTHIIVMNFSFFVQMSDENTYPYFPGSRKYFPGNRDEKKAGISRDGNSREGTLILIAVIFLIALFFIDISTFFDDSFTMIICYNRMYRQTTV